MASNAQTKDAPSSDGSQEVLIDGKLYDVTNLKHPGGSIIKFLTGAGDATEAFTEFHLRSEKAKRMLKSLPCREAPEHIRKAREHNNKPQLTKDFAALRADLVKEGFFNPSSAEIVYRLSEIVVMHVLGAWLLMNPAHHVVVRAFGLLVLGIVQGRCGWLMHEGGHYSLTSHIPTDRALQILLYGTGCGMSASWWRNQHNKHHATPQKLKHDVDLDTLPLVAFNQAIIDAAKVRKNGLLAAWLRWQAFLFIPVSCLLVALGWQLFLHPRHMYRQLVSGRGPKGTAVMAFAELATLAVRYVVAFGVVLRGLSFSHAVAVYLLYDFVGAAYIFTNFALSHTHLPVSRSDAFIHWVEYAAFHTTNIAPSWLCNWWMAYLNFQIEHHLFPSMPQFRHPLVSPRVRAMFEKNGLPYDSRPYFTCLGETLRNLNTVGKALTTAPLPVKAKGA